MSDTFANVQHQIASAGKLQSVVHTMKALAASNIRNYEQAVYASTHYAHNIELGLATCFHQMASSIVPPPVKTSTASCAIVFGSDQGLVGAFNERLAEFVFHNLTLPKEATKVFAVGERMYMLLKTMGLSLAEPFSAPHSVPAITPLVGQILLDSHIGNMERMDIFYNYSRPGHIYKPSQQNLLPLDVLWKKNLSEIPWPTPYLPEIKAGHELTLRVLIREYLFISLFKACAESLASENASRLAAMERAEKNIEERIRDLNQHFHHLRQSAIDEELFEIIADYETLTHGLN